MKNFENQKISYAKYDSDYVSGYKENKTDFETVMKDVTELFGLQGPAGTDSETTQQKDSADQHPESDNDGALVKMCIRDSTSAPAAHLSVLCNQMVNFLGIMQNEWAGAQAFSSFDTYLAPFVKVDNLTYPEVKKCIESFISVSYTHLDVYKRQILPWTICLP